MAEYADEVVERCVQLVQKMAGYAFVSAHNHGGLLADDCREARAIVALLPAPVDPDVLEARKVAIEISQLVGWGAYDFTTGEYDDSPGMQGLAAAIKRGRHLAEQSK